MRNERNGIVINHNIPLTAEQRRQIASEPHPVEVIGVSVPAWIIDGVNEEPTREVFCKYTVSSYRVQTNMVIPDKNGYIVNIGTDELAKNLLDIREGGIGNLWLNETAPIEDGGERYTAIHQIHILDADALRKSFAFMHLD